MQQTVPYFERISVVAFRSGSVLADLEVVVKADQGQGSQVKDEVKAAMTDEVKDGSLGGKLAVDTTVEVKAMAVEGEHVTFCFILDLD